MTIYKLIDMSDRRGAPSDLAQRLTEWHDAMVAHERSRQRHASGRLCDDDCPHEEARELWAEAVATLGDRAHDLTFLRTRALGTVRS